MNDNDYMAIALELAARGAGRVSPNPMVGAVVVRDGRIVGKGYHQAVGGPHAEVHALDDAAEQAMGATLYVTLEPCNHHGRTPPCTEKILRSGIRRVVVAMADPNPDVRGGGNAFLRDHGLEVVCGIREAEARRLNEGFVKFVRTRRPFVVLKIAATLDGRTATSNGDSRWVTGPEARSMVHRMRHRMDAILVGIGTVKADDPQLTARLPDEAGVDPIRLVLDTHLAMPLDAQMLRQRSEAPTYLVCGPETDRQRRRMLTECGARILEVPLKGAHVDMVALMAQLGQMNIASVLIEGGATVAGSALRSDIVDKVALFYAPKLLGGEGVPMCAGPGPQWMKEALPLENVTVERVGADILVQGYRHDIGE
jgi:diaminohydroxyphosphoribosylaminopyrimidine deaminase/5-amino-6-(5-phosphoribosylamino)uracil reductase